MQHYTPRQRMTPDYVAPQFWILICATLAGFVAFMAWLYVLIIVASGVWAILAFFFATASMICAGYTMGRAEQYVFSRVIDCRNGKR